VASQQRTAPITAEEVLAETIREHGEDRVTAGTLSVTYESMQAMGARKKTGVFYSPAQLANAVSRLSLQVALRRMGPEANDVLRIVAYDPACGCGVFLVGAAQFLARTYAERLVGGEPSPSLILAVLPMVILRCVYGKDIDPVAVELSRIALSLETGGVVRPEMLEQHIVAGDSLEGPEGPPAMEDCLKRPEQHEVGPGRGEGAASAPHQPGPIQPTQPQGDLARAPAPEADHADLFAEDARGPDGG
jgi:hypothetical protein